MRQLSTTMFLAALLLLTAAIWAEHVSPRIWSERLMIPELEPEPNRHTPRYVEGTYLPPSITQDLTLTANQSPVFLTSNTRILPGVTVSVAAGTVLLTHEFAGLSVAGTLLVEGTAESPISFMSNETHPLNQSWTGITVENDGRAVLHYAHIEHASPAVSCLPGSTVAIANSTINSGSLGIFAASDNCDLTHSSIQNVLDGIIAINTTAQPSQTTISAQRHTIKYVRPL